MVVVWSIVRTTSISHVCTGNPTTWQWHDPFSGWISHTACAAASPLLTTFAETLCNPSRNCINESSAKSRDMTCLNR